MKDKILEILEKTYKGIKIFIFGIIFVVIFKSTIAANIDITIYNTILPNLRIKVPFPNSSYIFIETLILLVVLLVLKKKKSAAFLAINYIIFPTLELLMKPIIRMYETETYSLIQVANASSTGNMISITTFYGFIIYLILKNIKNKYIKYSLSILLAIYILSIGLYEISNMFQYTSDVISNIVIGIAYLIGYINICESIEKLD